MHPGTGTGGNRRDAGAGLMRPLSRTGVRGRGPLLPSLRVPRQVPQPGQDAHMPGVRQEGGGGELLPRVRAVLPVTVGLMANGRVEGGAVAEGGA